MKKQSQKTKSIDTNLSNELQYNIFQIQDMFDLVEHLTINIVDLSQVNGH